MSRIEELRDEILNFDDGSCRDINFDRIECDGVVAIIESLLNNSSTATGSDGWGDPLDTLEINATDICSRAQKKSFCHLCLSDVADLFRELQIFVCYEDSGMPFIELTFFPVDLLPIFTPQKLFNELIRLATLGHAGNFFLRYENVSWQFGTSGPGTGVIVTWHDIRESKLFDL